MKKATLLLAVLAMAVPAFGATYVTTVWTGTTGDFHTDSNWDNNAPVYPKPADTYYAVKVTNGGTPQVSSDGDIWQCNVGYWAEGNLEFQAGTYTFLLGGTGIGYNNTLANDTAEVVQTGGNVGGSAFILTIAGGTASGGSARGNGSWAISGGSLTQAKSTNRSTTVGNADGGNGIFKVIGTGPTLIQLAKYTQYAGSTLAIALDASGVTKVNVYYDATLAGTLSLDDSAYTATMGEKIDILTTSDGVLNYSGLTIDNTDWALTDDGAGTLQVQYLVPEPATMMLLGLGGLGVLIRRRRR